MSSHKTEIAGSGGAERHEEFVGLLTASHDHLLGYLMSLLGRWHDAQDVLQRASVLMWQKFESFQTGTDFMAWGSTFCFYEAKHFLRSFSRSRCVFDDDLLATLAEERKDDLPHQQERLRALELCLEKVSPDERTLLRAAYTAHGDIAATAERLGRAPRTLYNKLGILRRLLAECISKRLQEDRI